MKAFLALAIGFLVLVGCSPEQPQANAKQVETSTLKKGTKVRAILLSELTSGGTGEGSDVPMMVSEDIKDEKGRVLVAKGTPLTGEVTWSRTEGSLGAITNTPARLKFKFKSVKAIDGQEVNLTAEVDGEEEFELNRENTGKVAATEQIETLAADGNEEVLAAIRTLFEEGKAADFGLPENRAKMAKIAESLGLPSTAKVAQQEEVSKLGELVEQIRRGATVANLASGGSATLVDAALELAGVAGQVGNRIGKMLGGRNIRAYIGTPVEAQVVEDVAVKVST